MKHMKKLIVAVLSLAMVMGMMTIASAAETYKITAPENGHTYEAYQIFSGDLADGKLSNIVWGDGVTDAGKTAIGSATEKAESLKTEEDAKAFATEVASYLTNGKEITASTTFAPGYYLIKDKDDSVSGDDTYTRYIIKVVKNTEFSPKGDKPTVEKKVKDINDSSETKKSDWIDTADHDFGDKVDFQLTGTLPSDYAEYDTYYYEFHDTLSAGLTYNGDAKVYVVNGNEKIEITSQADVTGAIANVKIADLKKVTGVTIDASSKIVVEYTATLNENAKIGAEGNPNKVKLEYSNNPNEKGDGNKKPSTGETPEDTVIVFTYKTVVNKTDESGQALPGAGFTLYKMNATTGKYEVVGEEITGVTTFEFKGLDDGQYKLVETTTPAGYNTMKDQEFTITATHTQDPATLELTSLNGDKVAGSVIEFTADRAAGSLTTTIVNQSGATLPETGGMGTTMFYLIGGILVIGAGLVLITRRRMDA